MAWKPTPSVLLGSFLAASLVVILGLLNHVGDLRQEFAKARQRWTTLSPGAFVPALRLGTLAGDTVTMGEPRGERQLVFVFNSRCPFCKATLPAWDSLADSVRRLGLNAEIVGVAIDSLHRAAEYRVANGLRYDVAPVSTIREMAVLKAGVVPQTVVLGPGGQVRYGTVGQLRDKAVLDSIYLALRPDSAKAVVANSRR